MSERTEYPAGVPCWVDTLRPDPTATLAFYRGLFGWEVAGPGPMPSDSSHQYFVARVGGKDVAGIGSVPGAGDGPAAWSTYVAVERADDAAARAQDAGGRILAGPFDAPPAGRMAVLQDPAGATFCAWEPGQRQGAELVNAPGAWSMSLLSTPDPEGAKAFYAEVFGWDAEPYGDDGVALFRLPGYVGGEPQQPVPRDVVAVLIPGAAPAAWSVDFWVDDADALARRAVELGGAVVAGPHDGPVSRQAVVADPDGATLSLTTTPQPAR